MIRKIFLCYVLKILKNTFVLRVKLYITHQIGHPEIFLSYFPNLFTVFSNFFDYYRKHFHV